METVTFIAILLGFALVGAAGVHVATRSRGASTQPPSPAQAERMDIMRERLETAIDAARAAESATKAIQRSFETLEEDHSAYKKQLGGRYGQLSKRVTDMETLTASLAIHQGGSQGDSQGSATARQDEGDGVSATLQLFDPSRDMR